ncbi:cytosine permease [cf. Phormidesmis sp. LEGE 11477]|uniref:cytosine permease n=1 Tax=cf. Phormidesmis sp. LEGE 11477 TaxID=1828680 RepID=UPI00187F8520|nr:cytosine permease [cf. Phormidesmis sp. LEGE 11477]MBE9062971.1 cytosine permease [cf. Phormidesmis sp. LEGE 11477]
MSTSTKPPIQPLEAEKAAEEDYPLSAVPFSDRKPFWSLSLLLMGFALTSTTLFAGGTLGAALSFSQLLTIILIGNLILGAYCAALGYIACQSGLTTVLMARFSFGNVGSRWVDFILGATQIGWYAFTTAIIVQALLGVFGAPDSGLFYVLLVFFFNYAFCATAYIGYQAIDWLSRLAVPAMLVLVALSMALAARDFDSSAIAEPSGALSMGAALAVVIGTFISGGTQSTNWSRFADTGKNAVISTLSAFMIVNGVLVFAGAFCSLVYGSEDLVAAMGQQGILAGGILLLILNVWTTQDNTIYAFSVAGANMFRTRKRHAFVLGGATFALVLTLSGIYELLPTYLIFLGNVIPPVGGIIMVDFWLRHRGEFPALSANVPAFNWAGIIAYVVGSVVAYTTGSAGYGIGPVNGIVTAAVLYGVLHRVIFQPIREY